MGNMILAVSSASPLAATSGSGSSGNYTFLIIIIALFGLMYFLMIRPQRNRQRQMVQMQKEVVPGVRVRTTAGMYATVSSVEGDDVVLEVAPGVRVRYLRRAIMEVVTMDASLGETSMTASTSMDGASAGTSDEGGAPAGADATENGRSAN